MSVPTFAEQNWAALAAGTADPPALERFDPATLGQLPEPAQRLLAAAVPAGTPLLPIVELEMEGEIKLNGRWLPFTANQILRAGAGFVWVPTVGSRLLRFTGADSLGDGGGRVEFRLYGLIPVASASGRDVDRSAAGRLAAETVVWLPQSLTPQAGGRWRPVDGERAIVAVPTPVGPIDVEVEVGDDGRLVELGLQRWKDSAEPPGPAPFGGTVTDRFSTADGVVLAGVGVVGWGWRTPEQAEGEFFRYRITAARFAEPGERGSLSRSWRR